MGLAIEPSTVFIPTELKGSQGDRRGGRLTWGVSIFQFLPQPEYLYPGATVQGETHRHTHTHSHLGTRLREQAALGVVGLVCAHFASTLS